MTSLGTECPSKIYNWIRQICTREAAKNTLKGLQEPLTSTDYSFYRNDKKMQTKNANPNPLTEISIHNVT